MEDRETKAELNWRVEVLMSPAHLRIWIDGLAERYEIPRPCKHDGKIGYDNYSHYCMTCKQVLK